MYPIEIKNLVKKFGNFTAVNNISFYLQPGEIFGLLGPNGAGKTTTISILSTLEKPTSGDIFVFKKNLLKCPKQVKAMVGIVPQELISHGFFTVEEILHFQAGFYGIRDNQGWIDYILDKLELTKFRNRMASTLSGGYKRRLLIAKALVHKPKLLVLDEPTAGVDIDLRQKLWEFIKELNQEGMTIMLTTHYLEEAERLCTRIGIINAGKIVKIDETSKLIEAYTYRSITFVFKKPVEKISSSYKLSQHGEKITMTVPRSVNLTDLMKEIKIDWNLLKDIKIHEGALEDAFKEIIKGDS
ncbi:MAG: ABC transporter ATP-binding protein [Chlamydiae bacterium CG10_big_fil_rev_8_21_14_0_10_35_9]|nr:MAG: ABC transporter ATP-binding protein [Chlamydiae bacterium CG10_big_fil_rev_8_21_14_0_10_35_9]